MRKLICTTFGKRRQKYTLEQVRKAEQIAARYKGKGAIECWSSEEYLSTFRVLNPDCTEESYTMWKAVVGRIVEIERQKNSIISASSNQPSPQHSLL